MGATMNYLFENEVETSLTNLDVFKTWNSKQLIRKFKVKFVKMLHHVFSRVVFKDHEE